MTPSPSRAVDGIRKVTAKDVLGLLAAKHSGDVFVPECKDGPTHTARHVRLDAWVMPRSWAHPETTGYEIKVSRSDFLQDDKWRKYLPLCNSFWFVAPKGVIDRDELPVEAGLLEVSANCKKLYTRKKAPIRSDVQVPESVYRYVLMCRATVGEDIVSKSQRLEFWAKWLDEKRFGECLGREIKGRIGLVSREIKKENRRLAAENKTYEDIRKIMAAAGIENRADWYARCEISDRLKEMRAGASKGLIRGLKESSEQISSLLNQIQNEMGDSSR